MNFIDKATTQQVLGALLRRPTILSEIDKYSLSLKDFSTTLDKYIFAAINGLYRQGATKIEPIDVANYLSTNPTSQRIFENNNGVEYLQDIIDFSQEDNFSYYYNRLKKFNLLRDLNKQNFPTNEFYEPDLTKDTADEINAAFETLTTQDICDRIKRKLITLETDYAKSDEIRSSVMTDGIDALLEHMDDTIDMGTPFQGRIFNQVLSGAQRQALTIRSGSSGVGKTRQAVGDACYMAYPIRFNAATQQWEQTGNCEKVLFIITEQTEIQIQKMALAYLADMDENRFKTGHFNSSEMDRLHKAIEVMKKFEKNFLLIKMPNPTIESVKAQVREKCLTNDIGIVFYDYIFIGPSLLNEFKGFNLRNDEVLLMFATALKDLAVELNVAMITSTQVNASADDNKNIRNEASLAGGRSTINKADNGAIMARPTNEELEVLESITSQYGKPNVVTDVFKVRSGKWTQVRIWSIFDCGRMRRQDLFITDSRLEIIPEFATEDVGNYEVQNWDDAEWKGIYDFVDVLNQKG